MELYLSMESIADKFLALLQNWLAQVPMINTPVPSSASMCIWKTAAGLNLQN